MSITIMFDNFLSEVHKDIHNIRYNGNIDFNSIENTTIKFENILYYVERNFKEFYPEFNKPKQINQYTYGTNPNTLRLRRWEKTYLSNPNRKSSNGGQQEYLTNVNIPKNIIQDYHNFGIAIKEAWTGFGFLYTHKNTPINYTYPHNEVNLKQVFNNTHYGYSVDVNRCKVLNIYNHIEEFNQDIYIDNHKPLLNYTSRKVGTSPTHTIGSLTGYAHHKNTIYDRSIALFSTNEILKVPGSPLVKNYANINDIIDTINTLNYSRTLHNTLEFIIQALIYKINLIAIQKITSPNNRTNNYRKEIIRDYISLVRSRQYFLLKSLTLHLPLYIVGTNDYISHYHKMNNYCNSNVRVYDPHTENIRDNYIANILNKLGA